VSHSETFEFKTEARQILELMVHSVYSNKEIFLRELISNSSDALDKRRYESISQPELAAPSEPEIRIILDPEAKTLTLSDNGIGMSREEVHQFIGTIARSGAREFLKALQEKKEGDGSPDLIGQFGVGFYSAFMVADRVELITRRAGTDEATRWESSGQGEYILGDATLEEAGTTVILHLKEADQEDALQDYTNAWEIRRIVKKYSDFVSYPIRLTDLKAAEEDEAKDDEESDDTDAADEPLNSMKAIWLRNRDEVTDEEYNEFYKHLTRDWNDPLLRVQAKIEGTLEYRILLYIPERMPYDLLYAQQALQHGLHLYIKRIFIMDNCQDLLPPYFRFVRGVVDSEDLPLNISRELLQENRLVQRMNKGIVAKLLQELQHLQEKEPEKYQQFWQHYGAILKEGLAMDADNQAALLDLSLFHTTRSGDEPCSLKDYVGRMQEGQKVIYYLSGESLDSLKASPHLEAFRAKDIEVLLLSDGADEFWTHHADKYQDFEFKSIGRGALNLDEEKKEDEEDSDTENKEDKYKGLFSVFAEILTDQVKEVRPSSRLVDSVACLVVDEADLSPQLEKMMKMMGQQMPPTKRILEINPDHAVTAALLKHFEADPSREAMGLFAETLYGLALLAEGSDVDNPAALSKNIGALLAKALGM
jgi:molecular chaperone HtpG